MKIAVVLDQLSKGGTAKLAIEEVRELSRLGHDAELLLLFDNQKDIFGDILKGIKVRKIWHEIPAIFRINFKIPFFSFFSFFHLSEVLILPFIIKRKEYDFFVAHLTYTCFSVASVSKFRKIPYIAYIHDSISYIFRKVYLKGSKKFFFYLIYFFAVLADKIILRNAFAVCKQSKFELDYIEKITKRKAFVVPPSTYRRRDSIPDKRGDNLIAFTKWDFSKNFDFLIKLVKNLPTQKLIVAGQWHPDEYLAKVKAAVHEEGLNERIIFKGQLDEEGIKDLFDSARVLVHPLFEAWGSTLYEAACNGVTFIAPKGCGISDYLFHEKDAFFVAQDDLDGYLYYINKLVNDKDYAFTMGRQAWIDIKKIDIENHVKSLVSIMQG
ncbi:MAG: glycosyltransferase family 4 protein [Candidatus Omnitrophica bacterium]|nr:glycosyltransferase family 4 protein [Candidatus Omnitrophota bacterium]